MSRGNELPIEKRGMIIDIHLAGASYPQIASTLDVNTKTTQKLFSRYQTTGTCENAPRSGAPSKLDSNDHSAIECYIHNDHEHHRQPLSEINMNLNLNVSERTLECTITNK